MKRFAVFAACSLLAVAVTQMASSLAVGQEGGAENDQPFGADSSWYYDTPSARQPEYTVAQQKAMLRAEQRMARLAIARWYGYSASRPTHTGGTFTTIHNPSWGWSVGRPFGWTLHRPVVVVVND